MRDEDAKRLLGGVTNGPYYEMKRHPGVRVLDADRLLRISYLLGIFSALNVLHGQPLADEWIRLPNANRIFQPALVGNVRKAAIYRFRWRGKPAPEIEVLRR